MQTPVGRKFALPFIIAVLSTTAFVATAFAATRCLGINRDGTQCKNQVASGSYCHYHTPTPAVARCAATVKDGSPCRNNATAGSVYCTVHKK
jgi:hypothetical protein